MYDLAVIGGGPAGYHGAEYAASKGLSVALFEESAIGGTCLNRGCIPTKSLLHSGRLYALSESDETFDQVAALTAKDKTITILSDGISKSLKRKKVSVFYERASIARSNSSFTISGQKNSVEARNILIATGSSPIIPIIDGVETAVKTGFAVTSNELLSLEQIPKKLLIVGGGVVGFEMADYYSSIGSDVTIVELTDSILGGCDDDVMLEYLASVKQKGIKVLTSCRLTQLLADSAVCTGSDGSKQIIECSKVLICIGRKANTNIQGLDAIGLKVCDGFIPVDSKGCTNIAGIFAAGDVCGSPALASLAIREAELAVNTILGKCDAINYNAVCTTVFTHPELAIIGLSEKQAKEQAYRFKVKKQSINFSGRSVAENGISSGLCKLIIDEKNDTVIGAAIMGSYATEIASFLILVIQNKIPTSAILRTVFPHPTVCEIIRDVLEN